MADPNNLLIREHKLCLMLICKAANTSIKWAVAQATGLPQTHRTDLHYPTPNKLDVKQLRDDGYLVLSVIRHPFDRAVSCWYDKVARPKRFHQPFRRKYGDRVKPGMSFAEWVSFIADIPDGLSDQHFRSMSWDLVLSEKVIPQCIKVESPAWWEHLRARINDHCGLDIGAELRENRAKRPDVKVDTISAHLLKERYRQDFEYFGY